MIPVEPCHIFVPVLTQDLDFQCHMLLSCFVQCVEVRDECSFCLYWWNHLRSLFKLSFHNVLKGSSWLWSYSSWIYNYLCNQCLSLLNWVWIPLMEWCTRYNTVITFVSDLRQVGDFLWVHKVSSTNKTDRHDVTELLLKGALNTINQTITV